MSHPDLKTLCEGLHVISKLVDAHYSQGPASLDHPTILSWELDWRRKHRPSFQKWIDDREKPVDTKEVVKLFKGMKLFNYEDHDLSICISHSDNEGLVADLRCKLDDARMEFAPEQAISEVVKVLEEMESNVEAKPEKVKKKFYNGVKTKWTVPTALLSFADERYPFIRPSNTGHDAGPVRDRLFAGIPWGSKVDPERYAVYCERYRLICEAMTAEGLAPAGTTVADASAWMVAAHSLTKEPGALQQLKALVQRRSTILQGPPGTGKTHRAERLASSLADTDKSIVVPADRFASSPKADVVTELVQFHASFDYEDFVRGFRPIAKEQGMAFELQDGPFARMVSWALKYPETKFLLIVDEINRADLARVLGECIYLLDRRVPHKAPKDAKKNDPTVRSVWRGTHPGAAALRYAPKAPAANPSDYAPPRHLLPKLCVPDNFYLLGTMNTADRSIAVVDTALRRRFAFFDVDPDPNVVKWLGRVDKKDKERFQGWMQRLNGDGENEPGLIKDPRYHIGHSYFLGDRNEVVSSIRYQLAPLLKEYLRDKRFEGDTSAVTNLIDEFMRYPKP